MNLNMSVEEREAFLREVHVGVISIEDPGRGPLAAPIWYDYDPSVGVWVLTEPGSKKGRALDKAGRFSLVAQSEEMPYKYVSVEGPVVEVRPADQDADSRPMAHRYFGKEFGDAYVESSGNQSSVYVMAPERWLTLDYAKLRR